MQIMTADKANEIAAKLNAEDSDWTYKVEVTPDGSKARIAVYDEENYMVGYL